MWHRGHSLWHRDKMEKPEEVLYSEILHGYCESEACSKDGRKDTCRGTHLVVVAPHDRGNDEVGEDEVLALDYQNSKKDGGDSDSDSNGDSDGDIDSLKHAAKMEEKTHTEVLTLLRYNVVAPHDRGNDEVGEDEVLALDYQNSKKDGGDSDSDSNGDSDGDIDSDSDGDEEVKKGFMTWNSDDSVFNSDESDIDLEEHKNLFDDAEAALNIACKQAGMAKF